MLKKKVLHENINYIQSILKQLRSRHSTTDKVMWGIIPSAGKGLRFGERVPKQYQTICNEVILKKSISALGFLPNEANLAGILVVLAKDDVYFEKLDIESQILNDISLKVPVVALKVGEETRKGSVLAGLTIISKVADPKDWVLVHDAARPGLTKNSLHRLWDAICENSSGGILALPVNDTLKREKINNSESKFNYIEKTLPRESCWVAQTPQIFPIQQLLLALQSVANVTDESSAMEATGKFPILVHGDLLNLKITEPRDLNFLESQLKKETKNNYPKSFYIGQGFDVHALAKGRKLILGGVAIDHDTGLMGHSDADVLIHAIIDAVIGAGGLGDIGKLFPDNEKKYENVDSRVLLRLVVEKISKNGLMINQIDSTIIAEKPKLKFYIVQMVKNLKEDTNCELVNVKATTTEKLGYIGREEGIAAQAVVSLVST